MINTFQLIACLGLISTITNAQPIISFSLDIQSPPVAFLDEAYSFNIAQDTMLSSNDGKNNIEYTAFNLPSWLSFNDLTFTGTPSSSDFSGSTSSKEITLQGYDPNDSSYLNTTFTLSMMETQTVEVSNSFDLESFLMKNGDTTGSSGYIITPEKEFTLTFGTDVFTKNSSDSSSLSYGAILSSGNSPLPIWLNFDESDLSFEGTAPAVNSEIAAAQEYPITLYATTEEGVSMASIKFSLVVGAHSLSIDNSAITINTTSSNRAFTYNIDLTQVKLDGSEIQSSNLSSISLSSNPDWVTLADVGSMNYVLSGSVPTSFSSSKETFTINVFDIYGDEVNYNVNINYKTSTTSSSSSASSTSSHNSTKTSSHSLSTSTLAPNTTATNTTKATAAHSTTSLASSTSKSSNTTAAATTNAPKHHKKNKHITAIVCGVVIPVVVLIILAILLIIFLGRRKQNKNDNSKNIGDAPAGGAVAGDKYKNNDLEAGLPLALAYASSSSSVSPSQNSDNYEKNINKSVNDINAEALNGIPTAAAAAELDKGLQNFLQDSSQTENDLVDSSNTTNSASLYSPIRHSQTSFENQNLYYQSMKNKGKDSWRNVTDNTQQPQNLNDKQPRLSPALEQGGGFERSVTSPSRSDNRESYHTLNSISTDEFMNLGIDPNTSIPVDQDSHRKASLLNNRDSVFIENPENTITVNSFNQRPEISKKTSVLVPFDNVDSSVTKTDITDGQSVETASL